jgi:DNA-binding PadR family transcriptional regulator
MKSELYILGVLHRGDFHPYEIKRRLTQAMIECFTEVDTGTLYYAVRQLAKDGLLHAVAHERVARGGVRTVYRITPRGRQRFLQLLHQQLAEAGGTAEILYGPMLFLHLADLRVVTDSLRLRIHGVKERLTEIRQLRKKWGAALPSGSRLLMEHMVEQCKLDLRWLNAVVGEIDEGRVRDMRDPGRLGTARHADKSERRRSDQE